MDRLRVHEVSLRAGPLALRPMTEDDWDILLKWNSDPEVLYCAEGDNVTSRSLEDIQDIYRSVSQTALVFVVELDGVPIGECWLQQMNWKPILERHPGLDLRRIDLMLGEKSLWGKGWGTVVIGLLTRFGFEQCGADAIFACFVADYNTRSRRAFEKNGYVVDAAVAQPPGRKAKVTYDLVLTRTRYEAAKLDLRECDDLP